MPQHTNASTDDDDDEEEEDEWSCVQHRSVIAPSHISLNAYKGLLDEELHTDNMPF